MCFRWLFQLNLVRSPCPPKQIFGRLYLSDHYFVGCFPIKWFGSASVIHNLFSDQGTSNKLMNPLRGWICQFLWCAMIRVIADQWFWSSQRNTPFFSRYFALACRFNSRSLVNSQMYGHMLNIYKSVGCYLSETWTITNAPEWTK